MLLYMLPLLWPRSTLTRTIHESATWRLYSGREVMDTERLWLEDRAGFCRAPPLDAGGAQRSVRQSEQEPEGVGESGEEFAEERGEDEEEDDDVEEKASDTLLQELWNDCREDDTKNKRKEYWWVPLELWLQRIVLCFREQVSNRAAVRAVLELSWGPPQLNSTCRGPEPVSMALWRGSFVRGWLCKFPRF